MHHEFPHPDLARELLPHAFDHRDGAHDQAHLLRVWRNAELILAVEGGDTEILLAACLLHDSVWVDKQSPERSRASRLAALKAENVLSDLGWATDQIQRTSHAIEAHSFSAQVSPGSLEARILQDADRLDAIGFIGVARCMYIAGMHNASLYHISDPAASNRDHDDGTYALDHFRTKLFKLCDNFRTPTGQKMADERSAKLRNFYNGLLAEIG